ncbi:hypothetical protein ACFV0T_29520 [Streptomyces sp. NPDC059582]|uniref:hypothetical protein n=1 Tax=Streptomyces sp. NPDC059582 TaxID=3346875 RepID=UPI0036AD172A
MTTATQRYGLVWTDREGVSQVSAGRFDKPAAKRRRKALKETGCTRVEIVAVRPGEVPELPI